MRRKLPPSTSASVLTVSVLARPGTPSSSTWPPAISATSSRSSIASCPTITRLISWRASSSAAPASSRAAARSLGFSISTCVSFSRRSDEPAEPGERHAQAGQEQDRRPARESRCDLVLLLAVAELRAELLVHLLEPGRGLRREARPARGARDLL